ncbi:uncharacterized protein LOC121836168 [Ixodes scapularis]|uniref:uncharacterized protein LOC121836168 n=1 Tax=Ixodes scapularis TaxID=6945 RepID=UPI001C388A74|nr:uncharacterized protein LOC121836168 [Ixodes scapularis]
MPGSTTGDASPPGEEVTEKGNGDSRPTQETLAAQAKDMKFKLNPNAATLVDMHHDISEAIPAVGTKTSKTHVANLHGAYDRLFGFALDLINQNTALAAKMEAYKEERERAPAPAAPSPTPESVAALHRTFSQVLQQNLATSSPSPAGQQQGGALPEVPKPTTPPSAPRESLLIYPATKPAAGVEPYAGISHLLRTTFKPAELGLGSVEIKQVRAPSRSPPEDRQQPRFDHKIVYSLRSL